MRLRLFSAFFRPKEDPPVVPSPVAGASVSSDFDMHIDAPAQQQEQLQEELHEVSQEEVPEKEVSADAFVAVDEVTQTEDAPVNVPEPPRTPPGYARPGQPGYAEQQMYLAAMSSTAPLEATLQNWVPALPSGSAHVSADIVAPAALPAFCARVPFRAKDCADTTGLDPLTAILFRQCFVQLSEGKRAALYAHGGLRLVRGYVLQQADALIAERYPLLGWYRWFKSWLVTPHKDFEV